MKSKFTAAIISLILIFWSGQLIAEAGVRNVITTRNIPAVPEAVLQAFLSDHDLKAWWKVSRSLVEPRTGGVWSVAWDDWGTEKTQHAWVGVIDEISAHKLVVVSMVMIEPDMPLLGPMQLQILVEPAEGGSAVTVSHLGYGYGDHWDEIYEAVVQGWDHVLDDMQKWFRREY